MKICYFGAYEDSYPRNRIIINGLRKNNVEVIECHAKLWKLEEDKTKIMQLPLNIIAIPIKLLTSSFFLLYKYLATGSYKCQVIIVGYPAHTDIFLAYFLCLLLHKRLVFNPLISIYNALIEDRKLFKKNSLIANFILWLEKIIFKLPQITLLDTSTHIALLRKVLNLPTKIKMFRIFVGADEKLFSFHSYREPKSILEISFIGKFTPLHGLPVIIKAAKLLEKHQNIHFTIVGKGQLTKEINSVKEKLNLKNVKFISWVPYSHLAQIINNSDICLGIFDSGEKAQSVIPNKIYEAIAMGRTVITSSSPAIDELFEDNKNIILCDPNNPDSLAKKILFLQSNPKILRQVALEAHRLFKQKLTEKQIGKEILETLC